MGLFDTRGLKSPLFIVFEGIDGSGKSTLARMTNECISREGYSTVILSEPTKGEYGTRVRDLLGSVMPADPDILMQLFIDDRDEDVRSNIVPALTRNDIIIMDRYYHSNAAYQGASGLSYSRILKTNYERGFPRPDRVYLVDCEPAIALERISIRNAEKGVHSDNFERAGFLSDVRSLYKAMADETFVILDGACMLQQSLDTIVKDLSERFGND